MSCVLNTNCRHDFPAIFWQKRVNEWKVAVDFVFPLTDGSSAPSRNIWSCLELCRVCLWESVRGIFFFLSGGEFWIFLCHGSLAGSHFLPTWVTYKPAVISLQISNTARSKYIYVPFVCFFFSSQDLEWKSLSSCHRVTIYTLVNTSESRSVSTTAHLLKG